MLGITSLSEARVSRRERSDEKRARILEAARACFGEAGFAGATIEAIALRAGVSNGLLYQFFRGKDHLFEVVLQAVIADWVAAMAPRADANESASETLAGMFRRSAEFCRNHPLLPALIREDGALQLYRIRHAGRDFVQPHRDYVRGVLERGIASGELKPDLALTAAADVISQLQSHYSSRAYLRDPSYPDSPEQIEATIRFVLDAVQR
ncbi:MAG TPA: TetR/AcrR family transcriptional regulator [Myxococcota bacterium]|nr:TetR/AcrR family transcriptional regulator [Myxococcota bacterium]